MNWRQRLDSDRRMARQRGDTALPTCVLIGKDGNGAQPYVGDDPAQPILERVGPHL